MTWRDDTWSQRLARALGRRHPWRLALVSLFAFYGLLDLMFDGIGRFYPREDGFGGPRVVVPIAGSLWLLVLNLSNRWAVRTVPDDARSRRLVRAYARRQPLATAFACFLVLHGLFDAGYDIADWYWPGGSDSRGARLALPFTAAIYVLWRCLRLRRTGRASSRSS